MLLFFVIDSGPLTENNIHPDKVDNAVQQLPLSTSVGVDAAQSQGNSYNLSAKYRLLTKCTCTILLKFRYCLPHSRASYCSRGLHHRRESVSQGHWKQH